MNPHDWLFLQQCAEKFGDVLALFHAPLENSSLVTENQWITKNTDEVLAQLLQISNRIFLVDSNFDHESFNGTGRDIRECARDAAGDLEMVPAGEFVLRFRDFWLDNARSPITRGKVLLFIEGNSGSLKNVFRKATGFAFVPNLSAEVGKNRLNSVHEWLIEGEKRIVVYTRTRRSLVFMTTPEYMHELLEDYEKSHMNLSKPGSTSIDLDGVPSRVHNFISQNSSRIFSAQPRRVKGPLYKWIKGTSNKL